ncbi:MAG: hypothetical protein ACTHM9_15635 [Gemmatimonadales bacterium]
MTDPAHPELAGWESFYVIVGSSGAALIGLQFVVLTLLAETRTQRSPATIKAFGTPTVVHLGGALLISTIMSAPWPTLFSASVALGACGIAGVVYAATVVYHARRQTSYHPVWEDWLWHVALPSCAYVALALASLYVSSSSRIALFVVAGAALGLLLIAIHNAWDTVTYIVLSDTQTKPGRGGSGSRTHRRGQHEDTEGQGRGGGQGR